MVHAALAVVVVRRVGIYNLIVVKVRVRVRVRFYV